MFHEGLCAWEQWKWCSNAIDHPSAKEVDMLTTERDDVSTSATSWNREDITRGDGVCGDKTLLSEHVYVHRLRRRVRRKLFIHVTRDRGLYRGNLVHWLIDGSFISPRTFVHKVEVTEYRQKDHDIWPFPALMAFKLCGVYYGAYMFPFMAGHPTV